MTFVASIVNFLILAVLLTVILYRPITRFLAARQAGIQDSLAKAEEDKAAAAALKDDYKARLSQARKEVHDTIEKAIREGERAREEIIAKAREEARSIVEKARAELEREKVRAWEELRDEVASLSILAASKVVGRLVDSVTHERLVQELIEDPSFVKKGDLGC